MNLRLILIILTILIILAVPVIALNFNNISKLFNGSNNTASTTPQLRTPLHPLKCPTDVSFCNNGKEVLANGAYLGFGGESIANAEVVAVFDGNVSVTTTTIYEGASPEELNVIYIDNIQNNMRAVYQFKGQAFVGKEVKKGDLMGKLVEKVNYYDTWLLLQIIKGDPVTGENLKLSSADFN